MRSVLHTFVVEWTVTNEGEGSLTAVLDAVLTVRPARVEVPWRLTVSATCTYTEK